MDSKHFDHYSSSFEEPACITDYRKQSFIHMAKSDIPNFKYGLNISVRPVGFDFDKITPASNPAPTVKVDTQNQPGINYFHGRDIGKDIAKQHEDRIALFLSPKWGEYEKKNRLYHLHHAFANDFLLIHIEKNVELKKPITISYDINKPALLSNVFIIADARSKSTILFSKKGHLPPDSYLGEEVRIIAQPSSKIEFVAFQNLPRTVINIQRRKALVEKDARIDWVDVLLGTSFTKNDVMSLLDGTGAYSEIVALFLASGSQRFDISTSSIHEGQSTVSDINTKGVVSDKAKALSRGLVRINKAARYANGYENQDVLLLSDGAEADAIPNLEIHNNDVKCSHGSTIGQIDKDQLFYLMTRGLTLASAKKKIVEGYFAPILDRFETKAIKQSVEQALAEALG